MGIDTNLISDLASQQTPDWNSVVFAADIPQRLLYTAHRCNADYAQTVVALLLHAFQAIFDISGVFANHRP